MKQNLMAIVFGLAAIGGAFGLGWHYGLQPESSPTAAETLPTTTAANQNNSGEALTNRRFEEMRGELEQMRTKLAMIEGQQKVARADTAKLGDTENIPDNDNPTDPEALKNLEAQQSEAKQKFFQDTYQAETIDPNWSGKAQDTLRESYTAAVVQGVSLVDTECRSTLCRVRLSVDQPGPKGQKQLMETMNKRTPWPSYRNVHLDTTTGEVTMYMSREGATLPNWQGDSADGLAR